MIVNFEGQQHNFPDDASEEEIRSALSSLPAPKPKEDVSAGMALRGIPVLGAYVPQAEAAIRAATGQGEGATFGERYQNLVPQREALYKQAEEESPVTSAIAQGVGGSLALAPLGATSLGARALGLTGSLSARLAASTASSAGISAADAAARGEDVGSAAKMGAGIGAAAPVVGGLVSRAISPFVARAERAAPVAALRAEGVQPTAGEVTGSRPLRWAEEQLGELSGRTPAEQTAERFTGAALRRAGETGNRATQDVVDRAFTRLGNEFDTLAARNTLMPDADMGKQLRQAVAEYDRMTSPQGRVPVMADYEREIATALARNQNTIPGDIYQNIRSRMGADIRRTADPTLRGALQDMQSALDDAMRRHLLRTRSPDAVAWSRVRNQYRNMLVIERAVTQPGESSQLGLITPAALYNATKSLHGVRNMARGQGPYARLASAGSAIMRPLASSGTAQRMAIMGLLPAGGAVAGGLYGGDLSSAATGAAWGAGPFVGGRAIMSRPMQAYLRNQILGQHGPAVRGAVTGGLLGMLQ